jgi:hypothetical protein
MASPILSFAEEQGLKLSIFTRTVAPPSFILLMRTNGVCPIVFVMSSAI